MTNPKLIIIIRSLNEQANGQTSGQMNEWITGNDIDSSERIPHQLDVTVAQFLHRVICIVFRPNDDHFKRLSSIFELRASSPYFSYLWAVIGCGLRIESSQQTLCRSRKQRDRYRLARTSQPLATGPSASASCCCFLAFPVALLLAATSAGQEATTILPG